MEDLTVFKSAAYLRIDVFFGIYIEYIHLCFSYVKNNIVTVQGSSASCGKGGGVTCVQQMFTEMYFLFCDHCKIFFFSEIFQMLVASTLALVFGLAGFINWLSLKKCIFMYNILSLFYPSVMVKLSLDHITILSSLKPLVRSVLSWTVVSPFLFQMKDSPL